MRMIHSYFVVIPVVVLVFVFLSFSQTTEPAKPMASGMQTKSTTAGELLDDIGIQFDNMDKMIENQMISIVHEYAENIGNDCKELTEVDFPADSTKRIKAEGYIKSLEDVAVKIKEYASANDVERVRAQIKKGRAIYDLLVKQYPQTSTQKNMQSQSSEASMDMNGTKMSGDTTNGSEYGYWTCPLHPEINKTASGLCPICGKDLVYTEPAKPMDPDMLNKPTTVGELLDDISIQFDNIDKVIRNQMLTTVPQYTVIISIDCKKLAEVGLPANSKNRIKVQDNLKSMENIVVKLNEYAGANNYEAVGSALIEGRELYNLLVMQYPKTSTQKNEFTPNAP
jgi:Heavy metal binding domain